MKGKPVTGKVGDVGDGVDEVDCAMAAGNISATKAATNAAKGRILGVYRSGFIIVMSSDNSRLC
jgi:hypothetical protein